MFCIHCGSERPDVASFCLVCGTAANAPAAGTPASVAVATTIAPAIAFFNVGNTKLVLMTMSTFGVYEVYWLYKNWSAERSLSEASLSPFLRALFAPAFIFSLAERIKERSLAMGLPTTLAPGLVGTAFIVLSVLANAPDPYWMLCLFAGIALVPIQSEIARINEASGIVRGKEARYSVPNIVWLLIAGLIWLLLLTGMMSPDVE
jgi:hypothetical protein